MMGIEFLAGQPNAAVILGIVLAEAIGLYVVYGVVIDVANALVERAFERA